MKSKNYKSSLVKSLSASILMGVLMLSGASVMEANAKEVSATAQTKNMETKAVTTAVENVKIEDGKVYAYTLNKSTETIDLDTTNFVEDSRLSGFHTDRFYYLHEAGEQTVIATLVGEFEDKKAQIKMTDLIGKVFIPSVTALSVQVQTSHPDEDVLESPKSLFFINYDEKERVVNGKIQDGTIQANNKPYTVDVAKAFGEDVAKNPDVTFKVTYDSKITKEVNKYPVNIYMAKGDNSFKESDYVKSLASDKAIATKLLKASNNSFLTFEALSEGKSTITVTPMLEGKEMKEGQTFTLTLDKALKDKPTKPNDIDDNPDTDNPDTDEDGNVVKPTPVPPDKDDSDTTVETPNTEKPDTENPDTDKPNKLPDLSDDTNLPNLNDDGTTNGNKPNTNTNTSSDTTKNPTVNTTEDKMDKLPKTGQEESNTTTIIGSIALILGAIMGGTIFYRKSKTKELKE